MSDNVLYEYWREKLDRAEKEVYDKMLSAFLHFKEQVSCGNLAPQKIKSCYIAVCDDHPELFYLPYNFYLQKRSNLLNTTLIINNVFNNLQVQEIKQQIDSVCKHLAIQLKSATTDNEKERLICEYFINNITYEINNLYNQNAGTVLCEHKGQCSGISKAVKLLLNCLGIEAIVVNGTAFDVDTGDSGPHSWNIVKIDGEYFHLDVTFMIGGNANKNKPYRFIYYNYSDEDIKKNHVWDERITPRCRKTFTFPDIDKELNNNFFTILSLFELRNYLKKFVIEREHCMKFKSEIQLPAEKLMPAIKNCCWSVASSLKQAFNIKISIQGDIVTITW